MKQKELDKETIQSSWSAFKALWLHDQTTRHPNVPPNCLPSFKAKSFGDGSANEITNSIVTYITLSGGHANRIQSAGTFDTHTKRFRFGSTKKGTADIIALVGGRSLHIEVKYGRDKQSPAQKEYQQQIESSGGLYFIATSFPSFWSWITKLNIKSNGI